MRAEISPGYSKRNQKSYTCVQMVLDRRNLPFPSQQKIGEYLGLVTPDSGEKMPAAGWGIRIDKRKFSLTNFFRQSNLPLREELFQPEDLGDFVPYFIADNLKQGNDLMAIFRFGALYDVNHLYGHASLVQAINKDKVSLLNPYDRVQKVYLERLVDSISQHKNGKNMLGGLWVISSDN